MYPSHLQDRQWARLLWSAVLHADEVHLAYNMASFLYKVSCSSPGSHGLCLCSMRENSIGVARHGC
jgi:hypothetical protein